MRDFSSLTLNTLAALNIRVVGTQAAPAYVGDVYLTGRVYKLDNDGCGMIRSHSEVLELAQ